MRRVGRRGLRGRVVRAGVLGGRRRGRGVVGARVVLRRGAALADHPGRGRVPAVQLQPGQRGGTGAAGGLVGAFALVGEAGQDAGGLLVRAERGAAGGADLAAGDQVVHELLGGLRGLVVEELPVDHHHGGEVAGRVALDVFEGDLAVLGGLVVADAEVLLELVEDRVAAHHRAQRVGADPDLVVARGLAPVHRVEGGDRGHLGGGEVQLLGAEPDAGAGDEPFLRLHQVQQRQQGAARAGIAGDHLLCVGLQPGPDVGREVGRGQLGDTQDHVGHRSTPPITGSMDATATMTSATWPPSHIAAMLCRLVKEGSRKWTR